MNPQGLPLPVTLPILITIWVLVALVIVTVLLAHAVRVLRARRRESVDAVVRPLVAEHALDDDPAYPATADALLTARGEFGRHVDDRLLSILDVVRGESRARLVTMLVRRGQPERLRRGARSRRASTRAGSIRRLGRLALPEDHDLLLAASADRSAIVRSVAVRALSAYRSPRSVDAVIALTRDDRAVPSLVVMNALLDLARDDAACTAGIRAGLADRSPHVRAACARVLGELTSAMDTGRLSQLLRLDPVPSVQLAAATALARAGTAASVPALLHGTSSTWPQVRVESVRALLALPADVTVEALGEVRRSSDPILASILAVAPGRTELTA